MPDNLAIACRDIQEKLKSFQEDLLSEEEYRAFVRHIDSCVKCGEYVRAVGSLSTQIWQLGMLKVPADLISTILFRYKEIKDSPPPRKPNTSRNIFVFFIIAAGAACALFLAFRHKTPAHVKTESVESGPQALGQEKPVNNDEAAFPVAKPSEKYDSLDTVIKAPGDQNDEGISGKPRPLHWHFLYSKETQRNELSDIVRNLGINFDYEAPNVLIFNANREKIERLASAAQLIFTVRNYSGEARLAADAETKVIIYLQREGISIAQAPTEADKKESGMLVSLENSNTSGMISLHWHAISVLPKQPAVLEVVRLLGGSLEYESPEMVVFRLRKKEVKKLAEEVQAIEGVFVDVGRLDLIKNIPAETPIAISIYFSKQ